MVLRDYPYPVLFFRLYRITDYFTVIISCHPFIVCWNTDFHTEVFDLAHRARFEVFEFHVPSLQPWS